MIHQTTLQENKDEKLGQKLLKVIRQIHTNSYRAIITMPDGTLTTEYRPSNPHLVSLLEEEALEIQEEIGRRNKRNYALPKISKSKRKSW